MKSDLSDLEIYGKIAVEINNQNREITFNQIIDYIKYWCDLNKIVSYEQIYLSNGTNTSIDDGVIELPKLFTFLEELKRS